MAPPRSPYSMDPSAPQRGRPLSPVCGVDPCGVGVESKPTQVESDPSLGKLVPISPHPRAREAPPPVLGSPEPLLDATPRAPPIAVRLHPWTVASGRPPPSPSRG
ncbi:hypothetical protein U9M48_013107 [Paspalum notatum var. saurae]|uniref:Uncharacterized protein n=1 Tax=Paspalum notatum var. saurae TaxID=547442 RepID=A0AAQ3SYV0_PASNO